MVFGERESHLFLSFFRVLGCKNHIDDKYFSGIKVFTSLLNVVKRLPARSLLTADAFVVTKAFSLALMYDGHYLGTSMKL